MRFEPSTDPEVLIARSTTSLAPLVAGLLLLLPGLAVVASVFIPAEVRRGDPIPWFIGIPAGLVFFSLGAFIAFGSRSVRIDRRARVVEGSTSVLLRLWGTTKSLDDFDHLDVRRDTISSASEAGEWPSKPSYAVDLAGTATLTVGVYATSQEATAAAEKLSEFLGIDVQSRL